MLYVSALLLSASLAAQAGGSHEVLQSVRGANAFDRFGDSVCSIGDINQDGLDDYLVGAFAADPNGILQAGSAFVYSGADASLLFRFDGTHQTARLGLAVSAAGDVNNDGTPDFIVSAPNFNAGGLSSSGSVFIYSGLDGSELHRIDGTTDWESLGNAISDAGDLNADGYDDFILGSPATAINGAPAAGSVFAYSGFDGTLIHRFDGPATPNFSFGAAVSSAGDVDQDGTPDILIGASNSFAIHKGAAYLYSGATGTLLFSFTGTAITSEFGNSVAELGDLNADGFDDILVGASRANFSGVLRCGSAFAYSGRDGTLLYRFNGTNVDENFGLEVSSAGDIDGDGTPDLMASAPFSLVSGLTSAGSTFVYSGATGALLQRINGEKDDERLGNALSYGDINGDGKPDLLIGSSNKDFSGPTQAAGACGIYDVSTFLGVNTYRISDATGGTLDFAINFPDTAAFADYKVLFSTRSGFTSFGSGVPLGFSSLMQDTYLGNYPSPSSAFMQGSLDVSGDANASISFAAGSLTAVLGRSIHMAAIALPTGSSLPSSSSVAIPIAFTP